MSSSEEDSEDEYDSEEVSDEYDSSSDGESGSEGEEEGISKEEQEKALEELKRKQKEDEERLAEAKRKEEEARAAEKAKKSRAEEMENNVTTHQVFDAKRKEDNLRAIEDFKNTYKTCCEGKQGERFDRFLEEKDPKSSSYFPAMKTYIQECEKFKHCILDGELCLIEELPPWHCIAALDSLSVAANHVDNYLSIQPPRRRLSVGEIEKICDVLSNVKKIQKLSLSNTSGWELFQDEKDEDSPYMFEQLLEVLKEKKEQQGHEIKELELEYTMPNDQSDTANDFWEGIMAVLAENKTLSALKIAFKRRSTIVRILCYPT